MNNISRYLFRILSLVLIFLPLSFVHADVSLTSEGKVPGGPFTYLQEQIGNIELIPGPVSLLPAIRGAIICIGDLDGNSKR